MNFATAIKTCFAKYATFAGRARRPEYWYFSLFLGICGMATVMLDMFIFPTSKFGPLTLIFQLAVLLPHIAVTARRLHDIDKSGWWLLLYLIPIIGFIILIIWMCKAGTPSANRFGEAQLS